MPTNPLKSRPRAPPPVPDMARNMAHALDPVLWARECLGFIADPWQETFLRSLHEKRVLLNCARQAGKSQIAAVAALHMAIFVPGSQTLIVSPTQRQSSELFAKFSAALRSLPNPPALDTDNLSSCRFASGSRVISLPGDAHNVRGFSPDLCVVDEAAYATDDLISAIRPMLSVSNGRFVMMSTPRGRRGAFYHAWEDKNEQWRRLAVPASECPRITEAFLDNERATVSPSVFSQEYQCAFIEGEEQLFSAGDIARAIVQRPHMSLHLMHGVKPRWAAVAEQLEPWEPHPDDRELVVAMDVGQAKDHTAIVVLAVREESDRPTNMWPTDDRLLGWRERITIRPHIVWASRMMLNVGYPDQVADVINLMEQIAANPEAPPATLWIDATGIGRGLLDMFAEAGLQPRGVSITGGSEYTVHSLRDQRIPKIRLIGNLQLALGTGRLTVAASIPALPTWVTEMENYTARVTPSGTDSSSAFSENLHDDLVLATAIGCWAADHPVKRAGLQIL